VIDPVLANPAWHALRGPQAAVAEGGPLAFRYQPDVALFAALPDDPTTEAWDQLGDVVGPGGYAFLARDVVPPRLGWEQVVSVAAVQMVATSVDGELDDNAQRSSSGPSPDRSDRARSSWANTSGSGTTTAMAH
jgi:hypothetical protein